LKLTPAQVRDMPADDFAMLEVDRAINPWGEERAERYHAVMLYLLYHNGMAKRPHKTLDDFFLFPRVRQAQGVAQQRELMAGLGRRRKRRKLDLEEIKRRVA
jgi:hypothetical protein